MLEECQGCTVSAGMGKCAAAFVKNAGENGIVGHADTRGEGSTVVPT